MLYHLKKLRITIQKC